MGLKVLNTPRLLIRCYQLWDEVLLKDAIDSSLDHLQPWLEWSLSEPETLERKKERVIENIQKFKNWEDWTFGIFTPDNGKQLGAIGIHPRVWPWWLEIWYRLRKDAVWYGYMTEAVREVMKFWFVELWADFVEIHTSLKNLSSAQIPKRLWFELRDELLEKRTWPRKVRYMTKDVYQKRISH